MVELEVIAIEPEPTLTARGRQGRPESSVMLLRETSGAGRILPIHIGWAEAQAIEWALAHMQTPRPMTHDLMKNPEIVLSVAGEVHAVSARPSDAVALALRVSVPIFADDDVLAEAGVVPQEEEGSDQMVEEFREFIENVNPEDFAT
jgi:bifunctional DNase/RNase